MRLFSVVRLRVLFVGLLFLHVNIVEVSAESLTVVTWGGAYEEAQQTAIFTPFEQKHNVELDIEFYNGGIDGLIAQNSLGQPIWDVIDMSVADATKACDLGLLEQFDHKILTDSPEGIAAQQDFMPGSFLPCAVSQLATSTVLAYNDRAFPANKPRTVRDFFDIKKFPGKRAVRKSPDGILEWALLSYGVPRSQLYDLLSTERGLRLAFEKLSEISEHIIWWRAGDEPPQLLQQGKVSMATGYNGRFFYAQAVDKATITVIWDGQLLEYSTWVMVKNSKNKETATDFIRFATATEQLANLGNIISYGPTRKSAQNRIGLHQLTNLPMSDHLPNHPRNLRNAIILDHNWYAKTHDLRHKLFNQWLQSLAK